MGHLFKGAEGVRPPITHRTKCFALRIYGRKLVENGEFSIGYRNTRLKKVFNELVTN